MPNNFSTTALTDLLRTEGQTIFDKAVLRSTRWAEKNTPARKDERDPKVIQYEKDIFQNPDATAYNNLTVAQTWAALNGIVKAEFKPVDLTVLPVVRCLVLVPLDLGKQFPWGETIKTGTPYICVHEGHSMFRGLDGNKVAIVPHRAAVRVGNMDEIAQIVSANLNLSFVKNLGSDAATKMLGETE